MKLLLALLSILVALPVLADPSVPVLGAAAPTATGTATTAGKPGDPAIEREYQEILEADDAAQAEVDKWIKDNAAFRAQKAGVPDSELNHRIRERFLPVRKSYEDFLARHPNHVQARLAFGSFLGDLQDEAGAQREWEKALALDTNNPAAYNNLAGIYSETGQPIKAFEFYAKAIELKPREALYYHNFANALFVLRRTATNYYHLDEQGVYTKALLAYSNAVSLNPSNFPFASDFAQAYYSIKPLPFTAALTAWTNASKIAHDPLEEQGVWVHLARVQMLSGNSVEARRTLGKVTLAEYSGLKTNLWKRIEEIEKVSAPSSSRAP